MTRPWLRRGGSIALTLVLAGTWFVLLRPVAFGGPASYVIVSGDSMLPGLRSGDFVATFRQDSYAAGDVIVYRVPAGQVGAGAQVVHRIVRAPASGGYVTQGDNRTGIDPWRPTDTDVLGKMRLDIPSAGKLLGFMQRPAGIALIAALTAVAVAVGGSAGGGPARTGSRQSSGEPPP